jgi:hypothetical protein
LRYFLRRARRLVPRFTRAMGFSFGFFYAEVWEERSFFRTGLKTRHYKEKTSDFAKPGPNALGRQTGCADAQESAFRNGFVS